MLTIEPNERVTFGIRHEDEHLVVIEKRSGLVSTPGKAHESDSLLNGLFARWGPQLQNIGRSREFGLLHRLDKDTSGLVLVALDARTYDAIVDQFRSRTIGKFYWAVTAKAPNKPEGVIRRPILEVQSGMKTAKIASSGKPALTAYRTIEANDLAALLECRAVTGRLHQLRVHLASIHCPILGDTMYAGKSAQVSSTRLALHARRVVLEHPATGETLDVRSPWPRELRALLKRLRLSRPDGETPSSSAQNAEESPGGAVGEEEAGAGQNPPGV